MNIKLQTLQTLNKNKVASNCNNSGLKYIILLLDADRLCNNHCPVAVYLPIINRGKNVCLAFMLPEVRLI